MRRLEGSCRVGRIRLVCRLALRDMRHRPGQIMLLLLVITAAMSVLALGLIMHGVTSRPLLRVHGITARAMAEGRSQAPARVTSPG